MLGTIHLFKHQRYLWTNQSRTFNLPYTFDQKQRQPFATFDTTAKVSDMKVNFRAALGFRASIWHRRSLVKISLWTCREAKEQNQRSIPILRNRSTKSGPNIQKFCWSQSSLKGDDVSTTASMVYRFSRLPAINFPQLIKRVGLIMQLIKFSCWMNNSVHQSKAKCLYVCWKQFSFPQACTLITLYLHGNEFLVS